MLREHWVEFLFLALALLALSQIYALNRTVGELRSASNAASAEIGALAFRRATLEHDLRYYKAVASHSSLHPSVTLKGVDLDSVRMPIRFAHLEVPLVMYSVDPECPACIENLPFIESLHRQGPCGTGVVGVAVDGWQELEAFRQAHRVTIPVLRHASGDVWQIFPIATSPATIVVGPRGAVQGWWVGALTAAAKGEMMSRLHAVCESGVSSGMR